MSSIAVLRSRHQRKRIRFSQVEPYLFILPFVALMAAFNLYIYISGIRLAFTDAIFNDNIVYTVTYKRGPEQNREGSLVAGEAVFVNNGMIFNAKRTDKS